MNKKPYFYRDSVKRWLWKILFGVCIGSVVLEIFLHRHSHFADSGLLSMDGKFGFYGILGFLGCTLLILIAKAIGLFLKAGEDYYNDDF